MSRLNVKKRRGFTLIEMLVVIAIIVTLMGLLLPAIQRAREAANRTKCQSNMRQLGFAAIQANDQFKRLPPLFGGKYGGKPRGSTTAGPAEWNASVFYHLMPFMEQKGIHDRVPPIFQMAGAIFAGGGTIHFPGSAAGGGNLLVANPLELNAAMLPVPTFVCPSDSSGAVGGLDRNVEPGLGFPLGISNYGANFLVFGNPTNPGYSSLLPPAVQDPVTNMPLAFDGKQRLDSLVDGTTNTVLFSERLALCPGFGRDGASYWSFPPSIAPGKPVASGVATNCSPVIGFRPGFGFTWPDAVPLPLVRWFNAYDISEEFSNSGVPFQVQAIPGLVDDYAASSSHGGGINVVLGDASVRFVSRSVSRTTWRAVLTPNSGTPADRYLDDWGE